MAIEGNQGVVLLLRQRHIDRVATHRLDLSAAKSLGRVEISAGVADLFDETELTVFDAAGFTAHPTPGRSVFARFQLEL